ncbi:MAG: hypothetical protein AB1782_18870 [Cyanobacteriota bacterium]
MLRVDYVCPRIKLSGDVKTGSANNIPSFSSKQSGDIFVNPKSNTNVSFSGKLGDFISRKINKKKESTYLKNAAEALNNGDLRILSGVKNMLASKPHLTDDSQLKALEAIKNQGGEKEAFFLISEIASDDNRSIKVRVKAVESILEMAQSHDFSADVLGRLHGDLEPLHLKLPDELEVASETVRWELEKMMDKKV